MSTDHLHFERHRDSAKNSATRHLVFQILEQVRLDESPTGT